VDQQDQVTALIENHAKLPAQLQMGMPVRRIRAMVPTGERTRRLPEGQNFENEVLPLVYARTCFGNLRSPTDKPTRVARRLYPDLSRVIL
jgi:hypothetical protein